MASIEAQVRSAGKANRLRREGMVPAVVYGPTMDTISVAVDERKLRALFAQVTRTTRIDLAVTGGGDSQRYDVFVKSIQYDPIRDVPVHVDFYHPDVGHPVHLSVPVKYVGEAAGVKAGGVLNISFDAVPVHGLPKDMPPLLTVDVSGLEMHAAVRVRDLDFGAVQPLLPPERTLVSILAPRGLEVAEEGALGAEAGVEVEEGEPVEGGAAAEGGAGSADEDAESAE